MTPIVADEETVCAECGGKIVLDDKRGEFSCEICGLVVDKTVVDAYPEVSEGKVQREEPVKDKIYPQYVFGSRDAGGRAVDEEWRRRRKRTAEVFNLDQDDRRRLRIAREINQICSIYGIAQDIADRAAFIYRKILESRIIMKPSMKDLSLASIIAACRERKVFIDVQRICKELVGKPATPLRYFHIISRELGLKSSIPGVENYIVKFVSDLGGDRDMELEALRICRLYQGNNVNFKCLAAAATYMACINLGIAKTQKAIKDSTTVSEVTIRTWIAILKEIPGVVLEQAMIENDGFENVQDEE